MLKVIRSVFLRNVALMIALMSLISCSHKTDIADQPPPPKYFHGKPKVVWKRLQETPTKELAALGTAHQDITSQAWIELAEISKQKDRPVTDLMHEIMAWQDKYPNHPASTLLPEKATLADLAKLPPPKQIAVLLPQSGAFASSGKAVREGLLSAYYANAKSNVAQKIQFYDTQGQAIAEVYKKAINDGADFIIGPLLKDTVKELANTNSISVPTLALNYSNTGFLGLPKNLFEFGLLPEDEVGQMVRSAHFANYKKAIVIAPDTEWGKRLVRTLSAKWKALGNQVQTTWYFAAKTNLNHDIAKLLNVDIKADKKLMREDNDKETLASQRRQDFDVIFLFVQPQSARQIVPLLRFYYANNVPIYSTSAIYANKADPGKDGDLNGVIVCDIPWRAKGSVTTNPSFDRLFAVGQDAYLLSQSLPQLKQLNELPLYGKTGALTLASQQIHRRIPCVPIKNGRLF